MKTNSVFCSLSKKCKEDYSKEISEKLAREEEFLEEVYKKELTEKENSK